MTVWAAGGSRPGQPVLIGVSEKICQLTGDTDWVTGQPTAARTLTEFGLDATDLGYPVEVGDKLFFLFGDSWPRIKSPGAGEVPPNDAIGFTIRTTPPNEDGKCLELQLNDVLSPPPKTLVRPAIVGPIAVKQGSFNVPSGGVGVNGELLAFFWTDHCGSPTRLKPLPGTPLERPTPSGTCPESDDLSSIGHSVLARSDDGGRTFRDVVRMPPGFVYVTASNARADVALSKDALPGVFIFGLPRYRASLPYLALASEGSIGDPSQWLYFVGLNAGGQPKWENEAEWIGASDAGGKSTTWTPPTDAEIISPTTDDDRCMGEFSVTWNVPLQAWQMLYACQRVGVVVRMAAEPWGPWSAPTTILGANDNLGCRLLMIERGCGSQRDFWPRPDGRRVAGGLYAPFALARYTTAVGATTLPQNSAATYWLVSTWNPYEVTVMRTVLALDPTGSTSH